MMIVIRIWIQILDHFDFSETTWSFFMKFAPAIYAWYGIIPVTFDDDSNDSDLDPDSGSL